MGAIFSALMSMLNSNQQHKLIIVGLDNAGKTTTLYKLHLGEVVMTQPTIGSNVEEVKCGNVSFEVWDLGGQTTLRQSWSSYYRDTAAVIMMVDSTDRARVGLVKEELFKLLGGSIVQGRVGLGEQARSPGRDDRGGAQRGALAARDQGGVAHPGELRADGGGAVGRVGVGRRGCSGAG